MFLSFVSFVSLVSEASLTTAADLHDQPALLDELSKLSSDVAADRLKTLLELAQRTSSGRVDPFKEEISCRIVPDNLVTELFNIMEISHTAQVECLEDGLLISVSSRLVG